MLLATTESTSDNFDLYNSALAPEFSDISVFRTKQWKGPALEPLYATEQNQDARSRFCVRDGFLWKKHNYPPGCP